MKKYNRVQSYAIVNHACEVSIKRGEHQTDICTAIDVDAGFFSKCKSGKKTLSPYKLQDLIDLYGKPSFLQSGVYKQSERYDDVNDFINKFRYSHDLYLASHQLKFWKIKAFQKNINLLFSLEDEVFESDTQKYQRLTERLKELLSVEEFHEWFDLYNPKHGDNTTSLLLNFKLPVPYSPKLQDILDYFNIIVREDDRIKIEAFFQRLGMMNFLFESIEEFNFEKTEIQEIPPQEEYLIQGFCIFEYKDSLKDKLAERIYKLTSCYTANSFRLVESSQHFKMVDCDSVIKLFSYDLELYMTEKLNFYAYLSLKYDKDNLTRNIIITLDPNDVVNNLQKILRVIGGTGLDNELTLKKSLAEEGGTIPGITLLD